MMEDLNENLRRFRYEDIRKVTGCIKPCKYLKYGVQFEDQIYMVATPHYMFSVLVSSSYWIYKKRENKFWFNDYPAWS